MIVALTGTPGTGKSRVASHLRKDGRNVISLINIVKRYKFYTSYDYEIGSFEVDLEKVNAYIKRYNKCIVEGHLSHLLDVEYPIILRCHPEELEKRLKKKRFGKRKIYANLMCEMLDIILVECIEKFGIENVYEVDTTYRSVEECAKCVRKIADGRGESFKAGKIDWSDILYKREEEFRGVR